MERNLYNKIVENIYQSALEKENWDKTLASIAQALDYEGVAIVPENVEETLLKLSSSTTKQSDSEYYNFYIHQNPMQKFIHINKVKKGIINDLDYISKEEMGKSSYYVDFLNKYGCAYTERFYIFEKDLSCTIAAQRGIKYLNTRKNKQLNIDVFKIHIKNSLFIFKKLNTVNSLQHKLSGIYDLVDYGVCIIGDNKKIIFLNKTIQENSNDLFYIKNNLFNFTSSYNEKLWINLINSNSPSHITTFTDQNQHKILARIVPIPDIIADYFETNTQCQMVFFYDLKPSKNNTIDLLRSLGLSHAEAQLAQRIGHLETLKESAHNLSISYETARSSLKNIFSKLNINSQNELVSLITKLSFVR